MNYILTVAITGSGSGSGQDGNHEDLLSGQVLRRLPARRSRVAERGTGGRLDVRGLERALLGHGQVQVPR